MSKDLILVESRTAREQYINQLDILDKVKKLVLLPDDVHATVELWADYYEVDVDAVESHIRRNRDELESDGMKILKGKDLTKFVSAFETEASISKKARFLTLIPRRGGLRLGMLLRDSPIAKTVRTYLLDTEQENRKEFQRWMQTRLSGKTTRREETDAIKEILLSLVQKQNPESSYLKKDSEGPYLTYTQMVNRTLGIKPKQRDKLPRSYLRTIELMEHAIAQIIIQEAAKGTHYKEIFRICKQKCQQIKLVSFLPALPPTNQQLKRGS
jgi:hypothetical protein